jgi:hypothetical protein
MTMIANTWAGSVAKPKLVSLVTEKRKDAITISKNQGKEWPHPIQVIPRGISTPITSRALQARHRTGSALLTGIAAVRDILSLRSPYFLLGRHDRDHNAWAVKTTPSERPLDTWDAWADMQFDYKYVQARRLHEFRSDVSRVTHFNPSRIQVDEERMKREHSTLISSMPRSKRASDGDRREVYPHQQEIIDAVKSVGVSFDVECVTPPPRGDGRNGYGFLPPRAQAAVEMGPQHKRALKRLLDTPGLWHRALQEAQTNEITAVIIPLDGHSPIQLMTDRGTIIISESSSSPAMGSAMGSLIEMHADFDGDERIPASRAGQHGLITSSKYHQNPLLSFRSIPHQLKSSRNQARELLRQRQQKKAKYRGRLTKINQQRMNSGKH